MFQPARRCRLPGVSRSAPSSSTTVALLSLLTFASTWVACASDEGVWDYRYACRSDAQCASGWRCDASLGVCVSDLAAAVTDVPTAPDVAADARAEDARDVAPDVAIDAVGDAAAVADVSDVTEVSDQPEALDVPDGPDVADISDVPDLPDAQDARPEDLEPPRDASDIGPTPDVPVGACGQLAALCPPGFSCGDGFCRSDTLDPHTSLAAEVWVPPGTFWMGCNPALEPDCQPAPTCGFECPHLVTLTEGYAIDTTEVTNAAFAAFLNQHAPDNQCLGQECTRNLLAIGEVSSSAPYTVGAGYEKRPMRLVSHFGGKAFCQARGAELCTEARWERAARGGCETLPWGACEASMRTWPWGETPPSCALAIGDGCGQPTCGSFNGCGQDVGTVPAGASPYGALDMAGNVAEWVADVHGLYPSGPVVDPTGPEEGQARVNRGGSYNTSGVALGTSDRTKRNVLAGGVASVAATLGFRCCRTVAGAGE